MASSVVYRNDYSEPYVYHENAQTVPQGEAVPKVLGTSSKNPQANCSCAKYKVVATIALILSILSIISIAILAWLVVGMINMGHESSSNPKGDKSTGQATSLMTENPQQATSSAVYIRWGSTVCPTNASLIYKGIAGGEWYAHTGGGSNYLCLPETPEYDDYQAGIDRYRAYVYSAEYEIFDFPPFEGKHDQDVPCAVCHADNRISMLMIPAKMTCPDDTWTREYHGYLMAMWHNHGSPTEYICIDRNPEIRPGGINNDNGAVLYPVESRCDAGNLPCDPYINGAELTCVVCTK